MSFRPNASLAATCAVGVSLLLVACGGSASKSTATQENEEKLVKFAKCMREHGINVHASTAGGGVRIGIEGGPGRGPNPQSPAFQAAQKACQGLLPFKGPRGGPSTGGGPSTNSEKGGKGGASYGFALGG